MPLWESNEIYFVAGLSVLVTLGVFVGVAYLMYKRSVANGRRADAEQAALEKVLLRKEAIPSTSPPTKPLIVSPSFSSPNKVPARHLRSGSYSPTHYLSPYHNRQPRRNSSPTSNSVSTIQQQPKLPNLQLHHPQLQLNQNDPHHLPYHHHQQHNLQGTSVTEVDDDGTCESTVSSSPPPSAPTGNSTNKNENSGSHHVPLIKTNNPEQDEEQHENREKNNGNGKRNNVPGSLAHHNSQYYGTIPPRRFVGRHGASVAPTESHLTACTNVSAFLPLKCGAVVVPQLKQKSVKSEYVQLPGRNGADFHDEGSWKNKDEIGGASEKSGRTRKLRNCSPPISTDDACLLDDGTSASLRRKVLLQKQYKQQKLLQQNNMLQQQHHHSLLSETPGESLKMKHTVTEEIPYYISTQ